MQPILSSLNLKTDSPLGLPLAHGRTLDLTQPIVMGILNCTPDSFSDGGAYGSVDVAVRCALHMVEDGAAVIDLGGESSRPGAVLVGSDIEIARVLPVLRALRAVSTIPISVDTYRSATARAVLDAGADIVNDISALRFDPQMAGLVADRGVPVVLMHMQGSPETMQQAPTYVDCVVEIGQFFAERIAAAEAAGICRDKIVIDPGIGFGKRLADNLALLKQLDQFRQFGCPVLIGASRKSFIHAVNPAASPADRLGGSIAAAIAAVAGGAQIIRAHDVRHTVQALTIWQAIQGATR